MNTNLEQDVVIFQDTQAGYQFGVRLPLRQPAGLSDSGQESIWGNRTACQVVSRRVSTKDYNYREATLPQESSQSLTMQEPTTTGEVHHYAEPFLTAGDSGTTESGAYYARLWHERLFNEQYIVTGHSPSPHLATGQFVETDAHFPEKVNEGRVIVAVRRRGSRQNPFG